MKSLAPLLLVALAAPLALRAEDWPPLPPGVWEEKEDPVRGVKGAVVLEARIRFDRTGVEYTTRILVLNESGRSAAEFSAFPSTVKGFRGRTLQPDGRVLEYNSTKDFQKKTTLSRGETRADVVKLVAPGLSGHCIVDIHWRVPHDFAADADTGGASLRWRLIHAFPTRRLSVEIPMNLPLSWNLEQFTGQQAVVTEKSGYRNLVWTNLPGEEEIPYALTAARPAPAVTLYQVPEILEIPARQGAAQFWDAYAEHGVKPLFELDITKGGDYRAFSAELRTNLPEQPQAKAVELLGRLEARIRNLSATTFAEREALGKKALEESIEARDLKAAIRRQGTTATGMLVLFYHLLKDAGVTPGIVKVTDRDDRIFNFQMRDYRQFHDMFLGIPEEGKPTLYLDPGLRFAQPGLVLPYFQGVPALEVDPRTWKSKAVTMPIQAPAFNQRNYAYTLDLLEDEDAFTVETRFAGYPEYRERREHLGREASEQRRHLKEELESLSRSYSVTRTEVKDVAGPRGSFGWKAEGRIERPAGRHRVVLPFPGMMSPVGIPDTFPQARHEKIVLPYARVHVATCTFKVPDGYAVPTLEPQERRNEFGRVYWGPGTPAGSGTGSAGRTVTILLRVDLDLVVAGPSAYPRLKEYLGWVKEAWERSLTLEKL
jgi:hypothetical protein